MDKIGDCEDAERSNSSATPPPEQSWRGCSMSEIYRNLNEFELEHVRPVRPDADHTVLHHVPIREAENEPPRPLKAHHKWDAFNVRLPCSPKSQYPVEAEDGTSHIESRWEMIQKALLRPIKNSHELQAAILSYNTKYENQWNFRALHSLFESELDDSESCVFFEDLLPRIIRLALRLPELIQAPIPLLKQGQNHSITLTQEQIACLLANAFLCTFPRRNTMKKKSEYSNFPDINFNRLFQSSGDAVVEKIKCICHYFRRVCPTERGSTNVPTGVVTFTRRCISELPSWNESNVAISAAALHICSDGTIEDQGAGLLQVDFANKFLGGGVLGSGCVQEEIRFVICPELLVSKLFTECLRPTEALLMVGSERYSNYTGYARTFKWDGDHSDTTPRDSSRRRLTHIVAIDALRFIQPTHQYREDLMLRELNKAYTGFVHTLSTPAPGVASGNWGCGAFGGDARLKALLQLIVCAQAKRPLVYFTFGDTELRDEVHSMYRYLVEKDVRIQNLWNALRQFQSKNSGPKQLYKCLREQLEHSQNPNKRLWSSITSYFAPAASSSNKPATVKPSLRKETSSSAVWLGKKSKEAKLNLSEDVFAASSDSEMEVIRIEDSSSAENTESQASKKIRETLEDSDADDLIAAIDEAVINREHRMDTETTKSEMTVPKKRGEMRQCSLLDMLDKAYVEGTCSASKRHRSNANGT